MSRVRGFEVVTKYKGQGLGLPKRATKGSAGYDFAAAINITLPSIWNILTKNSGLKAMEAEQVVEENKEFLISTLVPTGIKAYMPEGEYLMLVNRSSNPLKNQLSLPNGIGIIDSDYYGNDKNEGEIFVQLINYGLEDYTIKKGDRIAQGIFTPYATVDREDKNLSSRTGGFGSSGKN
ncbi:MAG TPA: dUTP diphosphatase [Atopostipes sp.]|nr:dUTP diphosphatase [Atopostipes sp.]